LPLKLPPEETADVYYRLLCDGREGVAKRCGAGGMPQPLDDHGKFGGGEPGGDAVPRVLAEAAARAAIADAVRAAKAADAYGTVPAGVRRAIDAALESRIDWRAELRRFVGERTRAGTTSTRKRPNRRFGWEF